MKIGVIGAGNVGGRLGARWAKNGHEVMFAVRGEPSEPVREVLSIAKTGSVAETAAKSDVILLALPFDRVQDAVASAGDLTGKIVIDAVNPVTPDLGGLSTTAGTSAGEMIAQWAKGAKVVKAFNTVGFNIMENPSFPEGAPVMFYCGDDAEAKKKVAGLISELGFDAADAGPLSQCRVLEPFALLWITLAYKAGYGRQIGFRFMR